MKYIEFRNQFKNCPIIRLSDVKNFYPNFDDRRLYEWQQKSYLKKIANNFYIFPEKELNESELNFIANLLYEPSYLSLEYALNYYSLIPEAVFWRTNITSRITKKLLTPIGNFSYRKVKNNLLFGYKLVENKEITFKIAEPEKAILDFLYLRKDLATKDDFKELRVNKDIFNEVVNIQKLNKYLKIFDSKKLTKRVKILLNSL